MKHFLTLILLLSPAARAQDSVVHDASVSAPLAPPEVSTDSDAPASERTYKRIVVTDQVEDFVSNPAAPQTVSKEKMDLYKYTDVNRALRQTAGVYVRDEDGEGLRPNIGLRGTDPDRSKKVVIMEDGILAGPAPYSAPAAYYTPSLQHTGSLEIFKGFTAIPYGPNSVGGSVNYLSTDIPNVLTPKLEASTGAYNTQDYKLSIGDNSGAVGYLVQASRVSSDGFKHVDGGGDTGFVQNDFTAKINTHIAAHQNLQARLGYANENSDETYVGLSPADIAASPYRRYAATSGDNMQWNHYKMELEHTIQTGETSQIKTTLYRHDFHRLWHRLDGFRQTTLNTPSIFDVLGRPDLYPIQYQILSGQADSSAAGATGAGQLVKLDNERTFYAEGLQTKFNGQYNLGPTQHDVELGLRYHQDQIRRNHMEDFYDMTNGHLVRTGDPQVAGDMNSVTARAVTFNYLENMKYEGFVLTLLGRAERVHFDLDDTLAIQHISRDDNVFAPGAGLLYNFNNQWSLKGSINRGVTVAGRDDHGTEAKEKSINYEMGFKYVSPNLLTQLEVVGFYNDYSNITGTCSDSTGCLASQVDTDFNGGRAEIKGIEGRASQGLYIGPVFVPLQFNLTWLNAEFRNSFMSSSAAWGVGRVDNGDPLPYVPQVEYTLSVGTEYRKFKNEFAFIYQGDSYDTSVSENRLKIPAYGIIDWTARYDLNKKTNVFAKVDNLLAKEYVVAYKPYGARPGKPQAYMVGLSYTF